VDKCITHEAYVWANNNSLNKIKDTLKDKTEEQIGEIFNKIVEEKDEIITKLRVAIDKSIIEDIENCNNPKKCFLIIGENEDLIEGIVSFIYCLYFASPKILPFYSDDFTGNDDETIKEKLIYQLGNLTWGKHAVYLASPSAVSRK